MIKETVRTFSGMFKMTEEAVSKNGITRWLLIYIFLLFIASMVVIGLVDSKKLPDTYIIIAAVGLITSNLMMFFLLDFFTRKSDDDVIMKIHNVEERIKENVQNNSKSLSWEIANIKLERYLDRNLAHVKWIFFWTIIVMITGFVIIGYGIVKVYQGSQNFNATLVTTITGMLIEFLGASFLVVYKSTIRQAKEHVTVLERIHAVGMAVQILDGISDQETKIKDEAKVELAKKLLDLYGNLK